MSSKDIIEPTSLRQRLTIETLARAEPWSAERLMAIQGQCIGSLLKDWAANLTRRWGPQAESIVRAALGPEASAQLPAAPTQAIQLPVWLTARTSDIVIASFLDGDALALEACLWEDGQRSSNAAAVGMLRLFGPKMILKHAASIHQKIYDFGQVKVELGRHHAILQVSGSPLFGNPTWQLTQMFAQRLLLRASQRELVSLHADTPSSDSFVSHLRWK